MRRLLFIRHAETDLAGTFCGHTDPSLNDPGRAQVEALVARLGDETFDVVFSSDMARACQTADAIAAAHDVARVTRSDLREFYFGEWEGLRWAEIEARDPLFTAHWVAEYPAVPVPGGEPFASFRERVLGAVAELLQDERWGSAAVVTHAGVMRVVLEDLLGKTEAEAWATTRPYCCQFVYENLVAAEARR